MIVAPSAAAFGPGIAAIAVAICARGQCRGKRRDARRKCEEKRKDAAPEHRRFEIAHDPSIALPT
jgi:hypothetical protein